MTMLIGLLISWAIPAASTPMPASFCCWTSVCCAASSLARSLRRVAMVAVSSISRSRMRFPARSRTRSSSGWNGLLT
ncbi:MAG: hypothetical protein A3J75_04295 [Acidobacteria bacterium RBG_16_68_9]|nr:MAG: hypothetical protein A3J75_04295 [Acidobacteria bacterium RBG_16_68_9]